MPAVITMRIFFTKKVEEHWLIPIVAGIVVVLY
jgi:hypothetical protein